LHLVGQLDYLIQERDGGAADVVERSANEELRKHGCLAVREELDGGLGDEEEKSEPFLEERRDDVVPERLDPRLLEPP
jgi:hypothetical protein